MKFDIEKFKRREFVVNCKTEEAAINFLRLCNQQGIKWVSGDSLLDKNLWSRYQEYTCYTVSFKKRISVGPMSYFISRGSTVVVYDQSVSIDIIKLKDILQEN